MHKYSKYFDAIRMAMGEVYQQEEQLNLLKYSAVQNVCLTSHFPMPSSGPDTVAAQFWLLCLIFDTLVIGFHFEVLEFSCKVFLVQVFFVG